MIKFMFIFYTYFIDDPLKTLRICIIDIANTSLGKFMLITSFCIMAISTILQTHYILSCFNGNIFFCSLIFYQNLCKSTHFKKKVILLQFFQMLLCISFNFVCKKFVKSIPQWQAMYADQAAISYKIKKNHVKLVFLFIIYYFCILLDIYYVCHSIRIR